MTEFFVYILRCSDDSFYTGVTNDYEKRFAEHAEGIDPSCYAFCRRPVQLVYIATFREITDAIAFEKQVKGWSRRKKEALIRREYEKLPSLSYSQYRKRIYKISHQTIYKIKCVMLSPSKHVYGQGCRPSTSSG